MGRERRPLPNVFEQVVHVERVQRRRDLAGFDPVQIEDVADHAVQPVRLGVDGFEEGLPVLVRPAHSAIQQT